MARITIPYAVADFAEMRERGFYYVDKTNYIPGLEDYNAPIFLRPVLISPQNSKTYANNRPIKNS